MAHIHELLAVEETIAQEATRKLKELQALFANGRDRLVGRLRVYRPLDDQGEQLPPEITELATTVEGELEAAERKLVNWIDAALQKEVSNQATSADIELGGKKVGPSLPSTALLNLEKKLAEIRIIYAAIPTLDPSERWREDDQEADDVFVSEPRVTNRTRKEPRTHVLHPATDKHPAQVQGYTEDVTVGTWTTTLRSGMLSARDKAERLERLDEVIQAVKRARMRANEAEVVDVHLGQNLLNYINVGK